MTSYVLNCSDEEWNGIAIISTDLVIIYLVRYSAPLDLKLLNPSYKIKIKLRFNTII